MRELAAADLRMDDREATDLTARPTGIALHFDGTAGAKEKIAIRRRNDDEGRLHGSLGSLTPMEYIDPLRGVA